MVFGRGDAATTAQRFAQTQLTSYDKARKSHPLRADVDTKTVHFDWISKELECGICEKTIQNTMVVRNCMHRFCADCILQRIHTGARKCPSCHQILPKKTPLKSDANFDSIINKFVLSAEKRCVKRPITESSNLYFSKRRLSDQNGATKLLTNSNSLSPSFSPETKTLKNAKSPLKNDTMIDSTTNMSVEMKAPSLPSTHSDIEPPRTNSVESLDDAHSNVQQPTTSVPAKRRGVSNCSNYSEKKNKSNRSSLKRCEVTPVVVLQKSTSHERINGIATKSAQMSAKGERSTKCTVIHPSPGPSSNIASNQVPTSSSSASGSSNGNCHINGNSKKAASMKSVDRISLSSPFGSSIPGEDTMIVSPRSSEYLLMSGKQRLSSGIESELVLNPDASVINDDSLPVAAKHLRYIVTCPTTTVGHLCEYILQRIRIESHTERDKMCAAKCLYKRVLLCPVKSDLALDDVLVVNETGEGQFTTMNVAERNINPESTSVFTINSPFTALDESTTIEQLKAEHWANRKRPLKLVFKFGTKS